MNRQAPKNLKLYSRLYVIGISLAGIISPLMLISSLTAVIPGLEFIVGGVGLLFMGLTTARQPELIFILPFRAIRLSVIETSGGISLFNHSWETSDLIKNENMYAALLQGVNMIFREAFNKGDVQEVHMSGALVLMHRKCTNIPWHV